MPEELREQVPLMKEMLTAMGIKLFQKQDMRQMTFWELWLSEVKKKEWMLQSCQVIEIFFSWQQKKL